MRRICASLASLFLIFCFYSTAYGQGKFIFDPNQLKWLAYEDGELVGVGRASGGKHYCADVGRSCRTPAGTFNISAKKGPECTSSKYPLDRRKPRARMPYCSFFHKNFAIHGSNSVPGHNASHGCIRVPTEDARWLSQNFFRIGTAVVVKPYRYSAKPYRSYSSKRQQQRVRISERRERAYEYGENTYQEGGGERRVFEW